MNGQRFGIVVLAFLLLGVIAGIGISAWVWYHSPSPRASGSMPKVRRSMTVVKRSVTYEFFGLSWTARTLWGVTASNIGVLSVAGTILGVAVSSIDQAALLVWRSIRGGPQSQQDETE